MSKETEDWFGVLRVWHRSKMAGGEAVGQGSQLCVLLVIDHPVKGVRHRQHLRQRQPVVFALSHIQHVLGLLQGRGRAQGQAGKQGG